LPIDDEANVDKRRPEIGLPSPAEYLKNYQKQSETAQKLKILLQLLIISGVN